MSSYSGKKFVHPLSKKIGRRTGKNVLAGKNIRRKDDGLENFDDYFSESDIDVTKEFSRLHGVSEESDSAASQDSKENHPSLSNNVTGSQGSNLLGSKTDSKNHSSMSQSLPNSTCNTTSGQTTLSQEGRLNGTKFGWLRNKKIGRRTGKDVTANKQIRVNDDGFENFDDYLSESDVSSVSTRLSVSMRDPRRSSHHEYIPSGLAKISLNSQEESATDCANTNSEEDPLVEVSDRDVESQETEDDDGVNSENSDDEDSHTKGHMEISNTNKTSGRSEYSDEQESDSDTDRALQNELQSTTQGKESVSKTSTDGSTESNEYSHGQSVQQSEGKSTTFQAESEESESDEESVERLTESGEDVEIEKTDADIGEVSEKTNISHTGNVSKSQNRENVTNSLHEEVDDGTESGDDEMHSDPVLDVDAQTVGDDDGYHKSQTCTNIDVAGNQSGSITKLDVPASVVSFDKTRKRLSYSALEKGEESVQKYRKRIEVANEELRKEEETSPEPSKLPGEFHVISKVNNDMGNDAMQHQDTVEDDCDIMCLTTRPSKLYSSDKNIEDSDSDDDIVIMEEVKKTFIAHDKGKKSKMKLNREKRTSNSTSSENENVSVDTKKSRMVKSETKKRKSLNTKRGRRKTTHVVKEVAGSSEKLETKSVKGKRRASSKQDLEKEVNDGLEANSIEHAEDDSEMCDVFPEDCEVVGNDEEHVDEQNVSKNSKNKSVDKSQTKRRNSKKSKSAVKKLSKTVSAKKKANAQKGKRQSRSLSEEYNDMEMVGKEPELDSLKADSKDSPAKKSISKSSRTVKRKSSSDDASEGTPRVSKTSGTAVSSITSSKRRKSSKSQSSSSEDDHLRTNPNSATPIPDTSSVSVPTHFGSGVSFRVSRRSELLENIGSGYVGDVNVQIEPTGSLTPCITRPGVSKRKKGRRVTLCPEENTEHEFVAEKSSSDSDIHPTTNRFRHTYAMTDASPLPSPNSTPVHIHEVTHTATPHPGEDSDQVIVDRLIKPSPPVEGLRRSTRTRLKPVEWYKNERVVFDYRRRSGPAIIGVKPSLEVEYKKVEEQKRKKRQLLNQIKKATLRTNRDKSDRKLSMHVELPENIDVQDGPVQEITVYNQFSEMEDGIDCVARKDGCHPVGPNYGTPKKEDPYLITKLLSHPCMSAGKLCLKPNAEKPEHLVTADYLLFNIEYGKVLVKIHRTSTLLETGDIFMVPSGNTYSIQNLRADNARLHYSVHKQVEQLDNSNDGRSLHEDNL